MRGKRQSPQVLSHAFTCSLYKRSFRLFVSGPGGRHLGFQEDVARDRPRREPTPLLVGKVDGERACMHHPGEGCQGLWGSQGGVSAWDWMVSDSFSVVGLE